MKNLLATLLAVMMLTSIGCAFAEGTTEDAVEITFQDIPWGSSMEEVKSWAKENGFQKFWNNSSGVIKTPVYLDTSGKYSQAILKSANDLANYEALFTSDNTSFQIAGYTIPRLDFWFSKQDGETELGTVVVYIQQDVTDEQSQMILDDLEQKLITVYGENAAPSTDNSPKQSTDNTLSGFAWSYSLTGLGAGDTYRKVGAEDTAVCLMNQLSDVVLIYGKTDVFAAEETNDDSASDFIIDSTNIDGL